MVSNFGVRTIWRSGPDVKIKSHGLGHAVKMRQL